MKTKGIRFVGAALVLAVSAGGCGEVSRTGRAPTQIVIMLMEGASGATPDEFGGNLSSDVLTIVQRTVAGAQVEVPTVFNDLGRVTMRLVLKDPGIPGVAATPSALNEVTITRYRVVYTRADGRNTPGVDVPFPFDSGVTFTIPVGSDVTAAFELVRVNAKQESPLIALRNTNGFQGINAIAEVTFYGRDQAGNDISAVGYIGVAFGNFADPD